MQLASGQIVASASAAPLTTQAVTPTAFFIKASAANTSTVYVGPAGVTAATGFAMEPGDELTYDGRPMQIGAMYDLLPSQIYVVGSGGTLSWLAFR